MHLEVCSLMYRMELRGGRYVLHEHPMTASSWKEPRISSLESSPLVFKIRTDMCAFGMRSKDEKGEGPVLKPTYFLTNGVELRKARDRRCGGCQRHAHLISGRAAAAQVYPKALCHAVVHGIIRQAQHDAADIMSIDCEGFQR